MEKNKKFLLGRKLGMTQIFNDAGQCMPVTVVQAGPCYVVQIKTVENDGYTAVKIGFGNYLKQKNFTKSHKGQFIKKNVKVLDKMAEFRVDSTKDFAQGQELHADVFAAGDIVDVSGISKGKGFQGAMKLHGFHGAGNSHGHHEYRRAPGSSGGSSYPGRVFKGTKMPGLMGGDRITTQKLEVVTVNKENNYVFIKGSVPGNDTGLVRITSTVKNVTKKHTVAAPPLKEEKKAKPKKK